MIQLYAVHSGEYEGDNAMFTEFTYLGQVNENKMAGAHRGVQPGGVMNEISSNIYPR